MSASNLEDLLHQCLATTSYSDMRNILQSLGDHAEAGLDEPFGAMNFCWHAFGNNPSNYSSIGLGTKSGRSLTERITNAVDAILEDRVTSNVAPPASPRAAAQQWFGRPISGPDDGLFNWSFSEHGYDRRIAVVLNPSGVGAAPTVDVIDEGIGIQPSQFPSTILSLQCGNKITKWHLIGAFGQGGASTLAFCEYVLIVSRHRDNPKNVGFTIIRVLSLNDTYKEDSWGYLCVRDSGGNLVIPSCELPSTPLQLYGASESGKLPVLTKGTLVRHYAYKLTGLDGTLAPSPGNLYTFLQTSLFDPILPFRLMDLRDSTRVKDELVTGSRNRLMKLLKGGSQFDGVPEESGSQIRHYREMEFVVPHGSQETSIGVEYWVVLNYRKGSGSRKDELILRSQSNELYVQSNYPIVGTLNGQNQGEATGQILRGLGLGMVARHIVIHIDASRASTRVRRELFATSREGFKEGPVLADLMRVLRDMLEEDQTLYAIERELTEKMAKRESQTTSDEVKRQVTRLLLEAGFNAQKDGPNFEPGGNDQQPTRKPRPHRPIKIDPLPTLPFPEVTRFEIVTPKPVLEIRQNEIEVVLAETDADAEFDRRGHIAIRFEPNCLELAAKSPLRGGRIRWRLRTASCARPDDTGRIVATLTRPDGTQLTDSTEFKVFPSVEDKVKKSKGQIPPFEIIPINPDDDPEKWGAVWPHLATDAAPEEQRAVAYKAMKMAGAINVYYSTIFLPFKEQLEKVKSESEVTGSLFRTNYEVWIAYHAILQENGKQADESDVDFEILERLMEEDRIRVAQMQVKQALQTTELMKKLMREQTASAAEA
jgi:hypothetical protein